MQVRFRASNLGNDVRCQVCGQGFLVSWTATSARDRAARVDEILWTLRSHHEQTDAPSAHPQREFSLAPEVREAADRVEWAGQLKLELVG